MNDATSAAPTDLSIVQSALQDDYDVLAELGRGGMGTVYRARDRHLDREVAIKVLPFALAFDRDLVARFEREARTAAQLEHPHIVPIYRVGRSGQVIYFAMQLLRGVSLSTRLRTGARMTAAEVRRVLSETASALGHAHLRGVVHRDIKPDNIMLDPDGRSTVTDFGIARSATESRLTATAPWLTPYPPVEEPPRSSPVLDAALATGVDMLRAQMPKVEASIAAGMAAGRKFVRRNAPRLRSAAAQAGEAGTRAATALAAAGAVGGQAATQLAERAAPRIVRMMTYVRAHRRRVIAAALGAVVLSVGTYYALDVAIMHHSRCPAGAVAFTPNGDSAQSSGANFSVLVDRVKPRWTGSSLDVYYDACGMASGDFKTRVTVTREASGLQRPLAGSVQPILAIWEARAQKPPVQRLPTFDFVYMQAATHSLLPAGRVF